MLNPVINNCIQNKQQVNLHTNIGSIWKPKYRTNKTRGSPQVNQED